MFFGCSTLSAVHRHLCALTNHLTLICLFAFLFGWQKLHWWKLTCKVYRFVWACETHGWGCKNVCVCVLSLLKLPSGVQCCMDPSDPKSKARVDLSSPRHHNDSVTLETFPPLDLSLPPLHHPGCLAAWSPSPPTYSQSKLQYSIGESFHTFSSMPHVRIAMKEI